MSFTAGQQVTVKLSDADPFTAEITVVQDDMAIQVSRKRDGRTFWVPSWLIKEVS